MTTPDPVEHAAESGAAWWPGDPDDPKLRRCPRGHRLDSYSDWCEDCPNIEALVERIRSEAIIADRPGQYDRLNRIADEVAALDPRLTPPEGDPVTGPDVQGWSNMTPVTKRCPETRAHYAHEAYDPLRFYCPGGPQEDPATQEAPEGGEGE